MSDPFPLEHLTPRIQETILAEFRGQHPTVLDVLQVPEAEWLKRPSMGPRALAQLRSVIQKVLDQGPNLSESHKTDAYLVSERVRPIAEQKLLRKQLQQVQEALQVNKAELWVRGLGPDLDLELSRMAEENFQSYRMIFLSPLG
ncbi:hypothetical protein [Microvirga sp. KLBC 81]|uniref:hypothetical protein n=1 Tax=Microvirga sp. KLBC 81 TaxID=1862707 RepID=UPI001057EDBB|nr:hypothetical protein [Microvirga sp. KLBC 81]